MSLRFSLLVLVFVLGSFVLPYAAHAGIPEFGPIIPKGALTSVCPAGWGMLIVVINNLISFLLTLAIVFIAPLMIAYAGFLFVVNPVNSAGIGKAREILTNTIVGIILALAGYLIVDALMAVLYNANASNGRGGTLGTWKSLVTGSGDLCLPQAGALPTDRLNQSTGGVTASGRTLNGPPVGKENTACDPSVVLAGAQAGGYSLTTAQANTLACIAAPESNCGAPRQIPNYNWNGAKSLPASTAAGAYQVLLASNHSCYENSACRSAAGVSGTLNCQNGFTSDGRVKTDSASAALIETCVKAANNVYCSASAAACLLLKNGGSFSAWQKDANSSRQTSCINGT